MRVASATGRILICHRREALLSIHCNSRTSIAKRRNLTLVEIEQDHVLYHGPDDRLVVGLPFQCAELRFVVALAWQRPCPFGACLTMTGQAAPARTYRWLRIAGVFGPLNWAIRDVSVATRAGADVFHLYGEVVRSSVSQFGESRRFCLP